MRKRHKSGKAAGQDEIPYEWNKNWGEGVTESMTELFNRVGEEERECSVNGMNEG